MLWIWFTLNISRNNSLSLTQFSIEVYLENLHRKFEYHDLDLHVIFNVIAAILIVVEMVYPEIIGLASPNLAQRFIWTSVGKSLITMTVT